MLQFGIFNKENVGSVLVVFNEITGEPWFVAKDVCDCLGLTNSRKATAGLMNDEISNVTLSYTRSKGGSTQARSMKIVSESGLYTLIMRSRKKEAIDFQRWVTREVLPSIRKHGAYVMGQTSKLNAIASYTFTDSGS